MAPLRGTGGYLKAGLKGATRGKGGACGQEQGKGGSQPLKKQ